jgi:hypothetical protein
LLSRSRIQGLEGNKGCSFKEAVAGSLRGDYHGPNQISFSTRSLVFNLNRKPLSIFNQFYRSIMTSPNRQIKTAFHGWVRVPRLFSAPATHHPLETSGQF